MVSDTGRVGSGHVRTSGRAALVRLLERYRPADQAEAAHLERMLLLARTLEEPLSRRQPEAHFTASALVVDPQRTRTLLLRHRKLGRWLQPGGHVEPDDSPLLAAALREAREETGLPVEPAREAPLDLDVHAFPARGGMAAHLHLDVRFLLVADGEPERDDTEADAAAWLTRDEALRRADAGLRRLIEKGLPA